MELNWDIADANKYLTDKTLKIPDTHRLKVCKYKSGEKTCRYIALTPSGHLCIKNTPLKQYVDIEVANNPKWRARGNNCDGFGIYGQEQKVEQAEEGKSNEINKEGDPSSP